MFLIQPIFTLPFGFALQIYGHTHFEVPIQRYSSGFGPPKRVHRTDPEYSDRLSRLEAKTVKAAMQSFLGTIGMRQDVIFLEEANPGFCAAAGTNYFTKGQAAIKLEPGFYEADGAACIWLMKHEISHIKNNDAFTMNCIGFICQLAASIFGMYYLSFFPACALAYTVGYVALSIASRWREAKADDFAIENSTDEELKGGLRCLTATKETILELRNKQRNTFWSRWTISEQGESRFDFSQPSLTSRIQKIEQAMKARGMTLGPDDKLPALKQYQAKRLQQLGVNTG